MSSFANNGLIWLLFCEVNSTFAVKVLLILHPTVLQTVAIYVLISERLSTEGTDHFVLLEFTSIAVNQSGPLIHLMSCFLIKLFLIEVVLLLQLLT